MPAFTIPSPTPTAAASESAVTPNQVVGVTAGIIIALTIVVGLTNWSIQRYRGQQNSGQEGATDVNASDIEARAPPSFEVDDGPDEAKLEIIVIPTLPSASIYRTPVERSNKCNPDIASTMAIREMDIPSRFVSVADVLGAIEAHTALAEAWDSSDDENDEVDECDLAVPIAQDQPSNAVYEPEVHNVDSEKAGLPSVGSQQAVVEERASLDPLQHAPAEDDSPKHEAPPTSPVRRAAAPLNRRTPSSPSSRRTSLGPPRSPLASRHLPNSPNPTPEATGPPPEYSTRSRASNRLHSPSPATSTWFPVPKTPVKPGYSPFRRPPPVKAPVHRPSAPPVSRPSSQKYLPRPSTLKPTPRRPTAIGPSPSSQPRKSVPDKRATPGWRK